MTWIFFVIALASLAVVGWVILRKLPQLRRVDVAAIPRERERQIKEKILMKKLERLGGTYASEAARRGAAVVKFLSRWGRRAVQRLYRLEQYYQKMKRTSTEGVHAYAEDVVHKKIEEAWNLIDREEFIPAEKMFIDIISHNPKSVAGYENLGNMYVKSGQEAQAKETLQFALRLSPGDASVNVSLAELEIAKGSHKGALTHLRRAVDKRPKNPRYLDFYIESALAAGSLKDARRGIQLLKEVNPENQKISGFEERLQQLKDAYIAKTSAQASQEE